MNKKNLAWFNGVVALVTVLLYLLSIGVSLLGEQYFLQHQDELTIETYVYEENSYGVNYTYLETPFDTLGLIFILLSFLVPPFLVWICGYKYIKNKNTRRDLFRSMSLPVIYGLINIIFFFILMDPASGWEYELGVGILYAELFIVFLISLIINSITMQISRHGSGASQLTKKN